MTRDNNYPVVPGLDVKTIDFDVERRTLQERIGRDVVNISVEVEQVLDFIAIRVVQRMLAKTADEEFETARNVETKTQTYYETEAVPANWWSHILVWIAGGTTIPENYDWRWHVLKHAKLRMIPTTKHYTTTDYHITRTMYRRVCPHVHIPDDRMHMRWLTCVDDDKYLREKTA